MGGGSSGGGSTDSSSIDSSAPVDTSTGDASTYSRTTRDKIQGEIMSVVLGLKVYDYNKKEKCRAFLKQLKVGHKLLRKTRFFILYHIFLQM